MAGYTSLKMLPLIKVFPYPSIFLEPTLLTSEVPDTATAFTLIALTSAVFVPIHHHLCHWEFLFFQWPTTSFTTYFPYPAFTCYQYSLTNKILPLFPHKQPHSLLLDLIIHILCVLKAKYGIIKPKINPTKSTKVALTDPSWVYAMQSEYDALMRNDTWNLVDLPASKTIIECKWVLRVKENPDGSVNKYKARLVIKSFHQQLGFDYKDTFSPVIKPVTVKLILSLTVSHNWPLQ